MSSGADHRTKPAIELFDVVTSRYGCLRAESIDEPLHCDSSRLDSRVAKRAVRHQEASDLRLAFFDEIKHASVVAAIPDHE